jgi:hypothetical protein
VHPPVVSGQRGIAEIGPVVAQGQFVTHLEQRHAAEGERDRVQQDEPAQTPRRR